jgi:riboflavin transporter FmnP
VSKTLVGKTLNTRQVAAISIQSALSVLLYLFVKFPLPIFPSFLDIHVSEIPALISSFMYGPYVGCIIIFVRFLFKLPTTMTGGVGEVADLIIGLSLVITSSLIYRKNRTLKGAVISMLCGIGVSTVVACLVNYFILIPAYIYLANLPLSAILGACSMIPGINESNYLYMYVLGGALPFNLTRFILVFILTFILYKKVSRIIHKLTVN